MSKSFGRSSIFSVSFNKFQFSLFIKISIFFPSLLKTKYFSFHVLSHCQSLFFSHPITKNHKTNPTPSRQPSLLLSMSYTIFSQPPVDDRSKIQTFPLNILKGFVVNAISSIDCRTYIYFTLYDNHDRVLFSLKIAKHWIPFTIGLHYLMNFNTVRIFEYFLCF